MMENSPILDLILAKLETIEEMIQATQPEYLSVQEFARRTGLSVSGLRKMIDDKRIKAVKTGTSQQAKVLIPFCELQRLGRRK